MRRCHFVVFATHEGGSKVSALFGHRAATLVEAALVFVIALFLSVSIQGATLRVPTPVYPTVSSAYIAALDGDTIEVAGGLQLEPPPMKLIDGARRVTLKSAPGQRAILVNNQPLANDDAVNSILLDGPSTAIATYNYTASLSDSEKAQLPRFANRRELAGRTMWWSWRAPRDGVVVLAVSSHEISVTLDVFTGSPNELTPISENDLDTKKANQLSFYATLGTVYLLAVSAEQAAYGEVALNILMPDPPSNDDFESPMELQGDSTLATGYNYRATRQSSSGEPRHGPTSAGRSIWFSWTPPQDGIDTTATVTLSTAGSDFDTVLAVYRGDTLSNLSAPIAFNDDTIHSTTVDRFSTVTFAPLAGVSYRIAVDGSTLRGKDNEFGNVVLKLDYSAVNLSTSPSHPIRRTVLPDSRATFSGLLFAENSTTNRVGPLQVRVVGRSGITRDEIHRMPLSVATNLARLPFTPSTLPAAQQAVASLLVTSPPSFYDFNRARTNIWGMTALLEERLGEDWVPVDSLFLGYGRYDVEDDDGGLGTGAPRPPNLTTNLPESVRVQYAKIYGTNIVFDHSVWDFFTIAVCSDGTNRWATNATWTLPPNMSISQGGRLTIGEVDETTTHRISTLFKFNRGTYANATNLIVYRRPQLSLISNATPSNLRLQLLGELGRTYTIERAEKLESTNWMTVHSNIYRGQPVFVSEPVLPTGNRVYRAGMIP